MKKQFIIFYVAAFCIVAGLSFAMPAFSAILFYEDFEDALDFESPGDWRYSRHGTGSQELTTEQIRAGSKAYKFSGTGSASDYVRQELVLMNHFNDDTFHFIYGNENWIGFSIFLANGYFNPTEPGTWGPVHHQYHGTPDGPPKCDWVENGRKQMITINTKKGNWVSWVKWDPQVCSPEDGQVSGVWYTHDSFVVGKWIDFVINVKWSYNDDGFLKVWKDGVLTIDKSGGNCFNDDYGPYMKFGIYGDLNAGQIMTVYYDELRLGDGNSSYAEVAPRGSVKPLPPTNVEVK
jgi:hypothetical protein